VFHLPDNPATTLTVEGDINTSGYLNTGVPGGTKGRIEFADDVGETEPYITAIGSGYLEINAPTGQINYNSGWIHSFQTSGSEKARFNQNGWLGIGTQSPNYEIDVVGGINATNINATGIMQAGSFIGDGSALTGVTAAFTNNSDINVTRFVASNTLFVNGNRVGVGTSSPSERRPASPRVPVCIFTSPKVG